MKIYQKLHDAKLEIGKVAKNAKNPHFKNTYADLNSLIEAVESILLAKGLLLMQPIVNGSVTTIIMDVDSGEQVESAMLIPANLNPQQAGSAITYFRRYTLQSLLTLQAVDDDGQASVSKKEFFNESKFEAAKLANANIEKIKLKYEITPEMELKYLEFLK
jgi:hypothetical protein